MPLRYYLTRKPGPDVVIVRAFRAIEDDHIGALYLLGVSLRALRRQMRTLLKWYFGKKTKLPADVLSAIKDGVYDEKVTGPNAGSLVSQTLCEDVGKQIA